MDMKPAWLEKLMSESFFGSCGVHQNLRKNEKNVLCLHCCITICSHCLHSHPSHPLLQVRRYVYHDVVRSSDLVKLIDCSNIQTYTVNGAKVIFLQQRRAQSGKGIANANACCACARILQHPFHFCSLSCKVDHMLYEGENLCTILHRFNESDFSFSQFEGLRVDGSEVIYQDTHFAPANSSSFNTEVISNSVISCEESIAKNKKTNGFFLSHSSRRKGAPQRAPLS